VREAHRSRFALVRAAFDGARTVSPGLNDFRGTQRRRQLKAWRNSKSYERATWVGSIEAIRAACRPPQQLSR